jgi:DNA modification methylase
VTYFGLRDYGIAQQIGLEPTPEAYVAALVAVFRDVRRVLKDDGVCWLNLGDSYSAGCSGRREGASTSSNLTRVGPDNQVFKQPHVNRGVPEGMKSKDLLGIPWRVAFALQAEGWYLRSDIIWAKPNPMPESVTDRPTKSHEYLFLLSKSSCYFYDAAAIREPYAESTLTQFERPYEGLGLKDYAAAGVQNPSDIKRRITDKQRGHGRRHAGFNDRWDAMPKDEQQQNGANRRTVWTIPTMPYSGAHFATMPEKLVEPCILAGSRMGDRVFDPFIGSGTVGAVAERLGRRWVGTDLNPAYHHLAKKRTAQRGLRYDEAASDGHARLGECDVERRSRPAAIGEAIEVPERPDHGRRDSLRQREGSAAVRRVARAGTGGRHLAVDHPATLRDLCPATWRRSDSHRGLLRRFPVRDSERRSRGRRREGREDSPLQAEKEVRGSALRHSDPRSVMPIDHEHQQIGYLQITEAQARAIVNGDPDADQFVRAFCRWMLLPLKEKYPGDPPVPVKTRKRA